MNPNIFANNPLDRASHRRNDRAFLADRLKDPSSLIVPFHNLQPFTLTLPGRKGKQAGFLPPELLAPLLRPEALTIFLGLDKSAAYFAIDVSDQPDLERSGPLAGLGAFAELRGIALEISAGDAAILAQAKSLIDWHRRHRFCANCGARTVLADAGYKRVCDACKSEHFPRTDPVAIMLAARDDKCLLGRGPQWPKGFYSALAGFIEPGEAIEDAVIRELKEETGVQCARVRYHSTQPWPYASSLMIGCLAEALSDEIRVDGVEIEDARWFTRAEARAMLEGSLAGLSAPPRLAIAHHLIRAWVEEG